MLSDEGVSKVATGIGASLLKGFFVSTNELTPSLEELAALEALFVQMDSYFSESGERRRFMHTANGLSESDLYLLQAVLGGKLKHEAALAGAAVAQSPLRIANALLEL